MTSDVVSNVSKKFNFYGVNDSQAALQCLASPAGCGRQLTREEIGSWDAPTQREYNMSGWCNTCQDVIFAEPDEDDEDDDEYDDEYDEEEDNG